MQSQHTSRSSFETQHASQPTLRPFLLQTAQSRQQYSLLSLWHLLSLDAPSVAAAWTWFIARCAHIALPWTSVAAMFLAVWMLYAADRLLDARTQESRSNSQELEERHRFHADHRRFFLTGICLSATALPFLLHSLLMTELRLYAALGSLLFAYFFLIHLWPLNESRVGATTKRLPKELAVGVFFAAAVFIPTVARNPALRFSLLPYALLFASICTLNCLYVYAWEHSISYERAHWTTRFALRYLAAITCIALLASTLMTIAAAVEFTPIALACSVSASCFLMLNIHRSRILATNLRAAVDLVLLIPLLIAATDLLAR